MTLPSQAAPARETGDSHAQAVSRELIDAVNHVIRGKADAVRLAVVALVSGGHLLIEDSSGTGKTLLAKSLAAATGGSFGRIQGTPDLLPADITGSSVYRQDTEAWEFRPGPIFANVVLADELNRATPRSQAAFLEPMEEGHVTVDGVTHQLPQPWFCVATQNPLDHQGTFRLPESQRDRFTVCMRMGLPDRSSEEMILQGNGGTERLPEVNAVTDVQGLYDAIREVRAAHCAQPIIQYVLDIVGATRSNPQILSGATPRASVSLLHACRAEAVVQGRSFVIPDDVKAVAVASLAHRVRLASSEDLGTAEQVLRETIANVPVPRP